MLTIKHFGVIFFLLYGLSIPIFSSTFVEENPAASAAMIACCCVIALLLYSGRALLCNLLISYYVWKVYLTRPYVDIFVGKLDRAQASYIIENNEFFNASDAAVVYASLLSLLLAWLLGLLTVSPRKSSGHVYWIFRELDKIVLSLDWRLWFTLAAMFIITYQPSTELWESARRGVWEESESAPLVAWGLLSMSTVFYVCLAGFLFSQQKRLGAKYYILLIPVSIEAILSVMGGGRSALFAVVVFTLAYWSYLNINRYVTYRDLVRLAGLVLLMPVVMFAGLLAQVIRPLLRTGVDGDVIWNAILVNVNIFNPENPLLQTVYFGVTELLHRVSSLQAQFMILNDHWINVPWDTFNPLATFQRVFNALWPGTMFPEMIDINRIFHHIYFDQFINYASHMFSIQGTLYLYFGLWISPVVVFSIAILTGRYSLTISELCSRSPAFATFFILLFLDLLGNGTLERVIPVDIVRPLVSFLVVICAVKVLHVLVPLKKHMKLSSAESYQ